MEVFLKYLAATDNPVIAAQAARNHLVSKIDEATEGAALYQKHLDDLNNLIFNELSKADGAKHIDEYLEWVNKTALKGVPNWAEFERLAFGHTPNKATFRFPWSEGKWGTRIVDDFVPSTGTIQEATKLKWSRLNLSNPHTDDFVRFTEKLKQAELDGWLLRNDPRVNQAIWYGTEALPTTGRASELTRLLQQNGIVYRVIEIP